MSQNILIILAVAIVVIVVMLLSRKSREKIAGICATALDQTVRKNANKEKVVNTPPGWRVYECLRAVALI